MRRGARDGARARRARPAQRSCNAIGAAGPRQQSRRGPGETTMVSGYRQRLREAAVGTATLGVALFTLRQSARMPGELSTLDRGILTLITPAQAALSSLARGIGGFAGRYMNLVHVRAENEPLRSDTSRLRAELFDAKRAAAESARYQRLLGLRDTVTAETLVARVVAIDASPYFRVARVQIDRGDGQVRRGMPVITPEGV